MAIGEGHPHLVFDLEHEAGPVEIWTDPVTIREMLAHDPARYSQVPPPNYKIRGPGWSPPSSNRDEVIMPVVFEPKDARCRVTIWDLLAEGGPAEVVFHGTDARDAMARSPQQYVAELPKDTKPGPRVGLNRIVRA